VYGSRDALSAPIRPATISPKSSCTPHTRHTKPKRPRSVIMATFAAIGGDFGTLARLRPFNVPLQSQDALG
jgi:hypothetical protein